MSKEEISFVIAHSGYTEPVNFCTLVHNRTIHEAQNALWGFLYDRACKGERMIFYQDISAFIGTNEKFQKVPINPKTV